MLRKSVLCMESAVKTMAEFWLYHIKSHYLLCNKKANHFTVDLKKKNKKQQSDLTIQVVTRNDRINTVHKVDDSTNIARQQGTTDKWLNPCINKLFTHFQISTNKIYVVAVYIPNIVDVQLKKKKVQYRNN